MPQNPPSTPQASSASPHGAGSSNGGIRRHDPNNRARRTAVRAGILGRMLRDLRANRSGSGSAGSGAVQRGFDDSTRLALARINRAASLQRANRSENSVRAPEAGAAPHGTCVRCDGDIVSRERASAVVEAALAIPVCVACALAIIDGGVMVRDRIAVAQAVTRAAEARMSGRDAAQAAREALPEKLRSGAEIRDTGDEISVTATSKLGVLRIPGGASHTSQVQLPEEVRS